MSEDNSGRPTLEQLDRELERRGRKRTYGRALRGTIWALVVVAAGAILCSTLLLSALQVRGASMEPTFREGEILLSARNPSVRRGDIVAYFMTISLQLKSRPLILGLNIASGASR